MRRLIRLVLAGAFCAGMGASAGSVKINVSKIENAQLIVYYFHGTDRCVTCRKFETWTQEVLTSSFVDEIKKKRLEYRVVNIDEPGNEHFVHDYGLYTKSVVLSEIKDGRRTRSKNLEKIWDLARDEEAYKAYVRDEVSSFIAKG